MTDNINHPAHYEAAGYLVQPIDVTEALPFCLGNAVKYLARAGKKDGSPELEDMKKARWYIERQMQVWKDGHESYLTLDRETSAALFILETKKHQDFMIFEIEEETGLYWCDMDYLEQAAASLGKRIREMEQRASE